MINTIYKHTNTLNGKCYIGQTCQKKLNRRWENGKHYKGCPKFYNAIKKYGWDNFRHEVLCECEEWEADILEKEFIKKYNSVEDGYNLQYGGKTNKRASKETIIKLRLSHIGQKSINKGKKMSESQKEKLRLSHLGKKPTEETNIKKSIALKGKPWSDKRRKAENERIKKKREFSEEARKRMSEAHKGIRQSEETKRKISEKMKLLKGGKKE